MPLLPFVAMLHNYVFAHSCAVCLPPISVSRLIRVTKVEAQENEADAL